jgi:hypothetical protein
MWPGIVYLNEVYPEPSREEIEELRDIGVSTWHVVGVKASAYPPFPKAYRGGIPCCAANPNGPLEAIVRRLDYIEEH